MRTDGKAIVATGHPLVSQAAIEILELGGNAYDAAIAAGFTSSIAEPALTSLGGGGFLLARTNQGQEILYDFFTETPGRGLKTEELEPHFFPVTVLYLIPKIEPLNNRIGKLNARFAGCQPTRNALTDSIETPNCAANDDASDAVIFPRQYD